MTSLLELVAEPVGDPVMLDVSNEACAADCGKPLSNGEDVVGYLHPDDSGLPGFGLFHEGCIGERLLSWG